MHVRSCVRACVRTLGLVADVVAEVGPVEGLLVDEGVVHLWYTYIIVCGKRSVSQSTAGFRHCRPIHQSINHATKLILACSSRMASCRSVSLAVAVSAMMGTPGNLSRMVRSVR